MSKRIFVDLGAKKGGKKIKREQIDNRRLIIDNRQ